MPVEEGIEKRRPSQPKQLGMETTEEARKAASGVITENKKNLTILKVGEKKAARTE